ncbi:MAG: hypothetical protein RJA15_1666 [Actinomycetota bacterium]
MIVQELGSLDALEVVEMESPELVAGHVRIAITACGLNYVDSLMIEGRYQIKPPVPYRPGSEVVGKVTEVASDVTNLKIGDRVFAPIGMGGFSDEAVVNSARLLPIPDELTDGQGATFMQSYLTAWFAFHKRATIREGATMLVLGAGGGVGLAAVDLGVAMGLRVIAAASSEEKRQLALDRGAFAAIDVLTEDVKARTRELCGGGVDMVYDPVRPSGWRTCRTMFACTCPLWPVSRCGLCRRHPHVARQSHLAHEQNRCRCRLGSVGWSKPNGKRRDVDGSTLVHQARKITSCRTRDISDESGCSSNARSAESKDCRQGCFASGV